MKNYILITCYIMSLNSFASHNNSLNSSFTDYEQSTINPTNISFKKKPKLISDKDCSDNSESKTISYKRKRDDSEDESVILETNSNKKLRPNHHINVTSNSNYEFFLKNDKSHLLESLVAKKVLPSKICEQLEISESSLITYLSYLYRAKRLCKEDTGYLWPDKKESLRVQFAQGVMEGQSRAQLIKLLKLEGDSEENQQIKIIQYLSLGYKNGWLKSTDASYLKLNKTKVGRNGTMKQLLTEFLEDRKTGDTTETLKDLLEEFTRSDKYKKNFDRVIKDNTLGVHISELEKDKLLSPEAIMFVNSCKDQSAIRGTKKQISHSSQVVGLRKTKVKNFVNSNKLEKSLNIKSPLHKPTLIPKKDSAVSRLKKKFRAQKK